MHGVFGEALLLKDTLLDRGLMRLQEHGGEQATHAVQGQEAAHAEEWGTEAMIHHIVDSTNLDFGFFAIDLSPLQIPPVHVGGLEIDICVANAGLGLGLEPIQSGDPDDWAAMLDTNVKGLLHTVRAVLPGMIARGRGHIVTIASAAGLIGTPWLTDYAASKHAAVGFDDALRSELRHLGHRGIRTTVVCAYFISTGMFEGAGAATPLFPILTPDYATRQIVRAIRRGRRRLLLPRAVALVYLGRLLPAPIFDWIVRALGVTRSMDAFTGRRG